MSLPHGLSLQTLLHTLECVDVASAHESAADVKNWNVTVNARTSFNPPES